MKLQSIPIVLCECVYKRVCFYSLFKAHNSSMRWIERSLRFCFRIHQANGLVVFFTDSFFSTVFVYKFHPGIKLWLFVSCSLIDDNGSRNSSYFEKKNNEFPSISDTLFNKCSISLTQNVQRMLILASFLFPFSLMLSPETFNTKISLLQTTIKIIPFGIFVFIKYFQFTLTQSLALLYIQWAKQTAKYHVSCINAVGVCGWCFIFVLNFQRFVLKTIIIALPQWCGFVHTSKWNKILCVFQMNKKKTPIKSK